MTATAPQTLPLDVALQQAVAHHQAGRLSEAEDIYRAILQALPDHPDANHNLGLLACQVGQHAAALPYLKAALDANPNQGQYRLSYIEALIHSGQHDIAHDVLDQKQELILTGAAHEELAKQLAHFDSNPSVAEIEQLATLFNQGRYAEVETLAHTMITRFPQHGFGWKALAMALLQQDRPSEACNPLQKATVLLPQGAEAHNILGAILQKQGLLSEAETSVRQAIEIKPDFAEAHYNLGVILFEQGRLSEAEASFRQTLSIMPNVAEAHSNLGNAQKDLGQLDNAVASYRRALEIKPDYADAHYNLGVALRDVWQLDEAVASYRRALEFKPDDVDIFSDMLFCLGQSEAVDARTLFAEHCRFGERFEAPLRASWPRHTNSRDPERCLQIGFVSGDLSNHAMASFIEPVLAHLAGYPQLSLHAYCNNPVEDSVTRRLRGHFKHWHPIDNLSDEKLAQKIRADGIDILIDLSGHTARHRLLTFARKPAPVQASWMGYPGTTGLLAMDYYLSDRFLLPPGQFDDQFTEKLVQLPANAPFLPFEGAPPVNALPALSNGHVTFGSFNRPTKLSLPVIALWAQLLRALPGSRMVLGGMPEEGKYDTLTGWFVREGIARERLDFHMRCGMKHYLGLHQQVDICLDTFPYNGGTTTLHALWMGVPTLTLAGGTIPSRTGAGVLGHVGLEAFVAHDAADFVQKGLSWAGNLAALSDIRAGLRERFAKSAVCQPAAVAAGVERALRIMWRRWCAGLPAESFEVPSQEINGMAQETGK